MTVLEQGKFIKNFVRDENGKKISHSNWRGYSKTDVENIIPKIDAVYLENWERFLHDKYNDEELMSQYPDKQHFLFALNDIEEKDIKKYDLPADYIII